MSAPKVCCVVGVGPGLGGSVAVKFAKEGYTVVCMSRKESSCKGTMERIKEIGGKSTFIPIDVCDEKKVTNAFDEVKKIGVCHVMVYNAGNAARGGLLELDLQAFKKTWEVGCFGALLCARQVIPSMVEQKAGTILITSATAAFRSGAQWAPFGVSKFGLRALSQSMTKEFAPKGIHVCHIRIDCILDTPHARESYAKGMPKEKLGNCDDIAETYYAMHMQKKYGW
eukprot:CAMPEP_0114510362 /NCGR_PEP_ID=MMETSP0109-20121206/13742_1 /TAXON_ID=29199 /ORGANISM="Chlorarachnion reptans, Strain CCCM449" /LENGTH=225 /DNA_ID=CAMNT_0001689655 /DNA_START=51 /DNA_END=725 /DNA_ORIENTATION=+